MRRLIKIYQNALTKRPFLMQAIQTGTLMGTGDIIAQTLIEKKGLGNINAKRTLQFASIGFCVGGPGLHLWYGFLNKHIGSTGTTVALKKVFVDQLFFAPTFLAVLLGTINTMQGKSLEETRESLNRDYLDVLKTNYYLWPWVQIVNFYFVPLRYQVLLVQVVAIFWNSYLSWKTNRQLKLKQFTLLESE